MNSKSARAPRGPLDGKALLRSSSPNKGKSYVMKAAGALAGHYGGATASAAIGVGAGANVLVGDFKHSIALQPVSIEGENGLNVAAGIAELSLKLNKNKPPKTT
jgi:hypothetical protein